MGNIVVSSLQDHDTISMGMKPKVLRGQIEFSNVNFSYPSRSDVQVTESSTDLMLREYCIAFYIGS